VTPRVSAIQNRPVPNDAHWSALNVRDARRYVTVARDVDYPVAMRYAIALVAGLVGVGCGTAQNTTKADAATGFKGQPCSQYVFCAQQGDGGIWSCDCGGPIGMVSCPAALDQGAPCAVDSGSGEGCYACNEGAGSNCECMDVIGPDNDGGPAQHWCDKVSLSSSRSAPHRHV